MLTSDLMKQVLKLFHVVRMSRELAFSQRQDPQQVHWFVGCTMEVPTQHTHKLKPIILYLFHQGMIIVDSVAFEEQRYGGDLIEW